jgi:hypothetical protein
MSWLYDVERRTASARAGVGREENAALMRMLLPDSKSLRHKALVVLKKRLVEPIRLTQLRAGFSLLAHE